MSEFRLFRLAVGLASFVLLSLGGTDRCFAQCYVAGWGSVLVVGPGPSNASTVVVSAPFSVMVVGGQTGAAASDSPTGSAVTKPAQGLTAVQLEKRPGKNPPDLGPSTFENGNLYDFPDKITLLDDRDSPPGTVYLTKNGMLRSIIVVGPDSKDDTKVEVILVAPSADGKNEVEYRGKLENKKYLYATGGSAYSPLDLTKIRKVKLIQPSPTPSATSCPTPVWPKPVAWPKQCWERPLVSWAGRPPFAVDILWLE